MIPDNISTTVWVRVMDGNDSSVYDASNDSFNISGNLTITQPADAERWITNEDTDLGVPRDRRILWTSAGSIPAIHIYYSPDNFTNDSTNITIEENYTSANGSNAYPWTIPDPLTDMPWLNDTHLPVYVKIRMRDANDSTVYNDSAEFRIDYYNITWQVRDWISGINITDGNVSVADTSGWVVEAPPGGPGLVSPIIDHKTPFGCFTATFDHTDFGQAQVPYSVTQDETLNAFLESKVVHVWEAETVYNYDPNADILYFKSVLLRDGSVAGRKDEFGAFYTIATNCTIEMYDPTGAEVKNITTSDVSDAGFFALEWDAPTTEGLNTSVVYNSITHIETELGGSGLLVVQAVPQRPRLHIGRDASKGGVSTHLLKQLHDVDAGIVCLEIAWSVEVVMCGDSVYQCLIAPESVGFQC